MSSRGVFRILQLLFILLRLPRLLINRKNKPVPGRILVFNQLLLGDALMATGLLATLRAKYPQAEIDLAGPPFMAGLYTTCPYDVCFMSFSTRDFKTFIGLARRKTYDHAYLVMDNRYSWTALALGVRWIVGYEKGSSFKNLPLNEEVPLPVHLTALPDLMANLAGPVDKQVRYRKSDWPAPPCHRFDLPDRPFAVLHLGASTPLKYWAANKWQEVAHYLQSKGITPVWSAGSKEVYLVTEVDPKEEYRSYGGQLDLPQLWHLIDHAQVLIAPDTGIVHIAKHTQTPTICLFGPGNKELAGHSLFFSTPFYYPVSVGVDCRDQDMLFRRQIEWVRQCKRSVQDCQYKAKCMARISVDEIIPAIDLILNNSNIDISKNVK